MRFGLACLTTVVSLSMVVPTIAAQVEVTSVTGNWTSSDAAVTGLNTNTVEWGTPASGSGRSGYVFDGLAPPSLGPFQPAVGVIVGEFTHNNFPIFDDGAIPTQIELVVTVQGTISEGNQSVGFSLFDTLDFTHFETPNTGSPCAAGGAQPCPDQVTLTQVNVPDVTVEFLGIAYGFNVNGFFDANSQVVNQFLTLENAANTVNIQGVFTASPVAVPLPASVAMLLAALSGFVVLTRRRLSPQLYAVRSRRAKRTSENLPTR
ncbi:MAG: THxN family PEP-CTERM protein [Pseudomonadota bacterium]